MKKYTPLFALVLIGFLYLGRALWSNAAGKPVPARGMPDAPSVEPQALTDPTGLTDPSAQADQTDPTDLSDWTDLTDRPVAPEANYAVNDPQGVISPVVHLVAGAVELERRELEPDAQGRPGRLRLMRADAFKYPLLRVEERFGTYANGELNPFPEVLVSVADHVMLQFDPARDEAELEALTRSLGGRIRERLLRPGLVLMELPEAHLDALPNAIASLGAQAGVRFAEPDWVVGHLAGVTPNDPDFAALWGLPKIEAPLAWEITTGRRNVVVGVIDSGVDYNHPDLQANIFYNTGESVNGTDSDGNGFVDDIRGWDFYDNTNDPMDENRHGTHVAGTIAAVGNNNLGITGVAWETRIMPLRFLGATGSGTTSGGINSIAYATLMGVDMTNNSWGGGGFSRALYDTIAEARDAGILFVAASGNSGAPDPGFPARYGNTGLPEGLPPLDNVISVAASENTASDSLASFSNLRAHIAAPGVGIYSATLGNGYESLSGTSMASPHVAGAAALLLAVQPDLEYSVVKNMLLTHVDKRLSDPVYELYIHSQGRLNINSTLRNLNIPIMVHTATALTDLNGPRAGNGVINPGETIELTLSLRSVGMIDTENVVATLSADSSYVTVTQATRVYGDFERYETVDNTQPFVFTVDTSPPTPYVIPFQLTITANEGGPWVEEIPLTVYTSVDVSGTVRHLDGSPFAGAEVVYSGPFSGSAPAGVDGTFAFEMVDGTYKVFAEAPGFRRSPTRLHTAPPGITELNFVLGSSVIGSSLAAVEAEARPGGRVELSIDLSNSGNLPLNWQLRETEYGFEFFENGLNDSGRPDLHWKEIRQEQGGPGTRISWWELNSPVPVTSGGVPTGWSGMERWSHGPLSFDFEFPFYGQRFSSARVNNAGWLGFTSVTRGVFYNAVAPMPDESFMDYKIAFQWALREAGRSDTNGPTHQKPNQSSWHNQSGFGDTLHAYAHNWDDHSWVFTWHQWGSPFTRTPSEFDTGQVELRSDGSIIMRYLDYQKLPGVDEFTFGGPFFFSAGLQDGSASRGMNPIFRNATPYNPTPGSVLVMRPEVAAAWIVPDRTAGTLASLEGQGTLRLTLDAGQLPPGVYHSSIVIDSDDTAGNAALRIPVTFTVSETAPSLVLTSPVADLTVEPGSDLSVTAVFDGEGTPAGDVELLNGDQVLATGDTFLWESIPGGFHELTGRVTLVGSGHTVYAPVRNVRAGKGLRLRWESEDLPMYSASLVGNPIQLLQPPVVSANRVSAERFDITPVTLDPAHITWWGSTNTRDPNGRDGAFNIGNAGRELRLTTNNYRKHPFSYTVTPNTVLEFEFRAFNDPADAATFVYGLGFAENNNLNANRVFRLLGKRNWGINSCYGQYPYSHSFHSGRRPWVRYRIPVGQHYTGDMQHLVFVAHSLDSNFNLYFRDVDAAFRNLRVFESTESDAFSFAWSFNDTARTVDGPEAIRTYFSPGTKEINVTVSDGPYRASATRVLELPGSEVFRVAVNFQPETATIPAGFVADTGKAFGDRANDLRYGWDSDRSGQTRDDNWLVSYGSEQGVTRIRAGNGASWRMAVPNGMYAVTVHTGASEENSNALLRFNGQTLLDRNLGQHDYAEGSLTLPVSDGEIVISSHRNTASLLYLEINRVDDLQRPPTASFTLSPQTGNAPLPVQFDAADSFDSDGSIVSYAWDFGDGFTGSGMQTPHSYPVPGVYDVTLTVTDNDGLIGQTTLNVVVHGTAQPAVWVTPPPLPPAVPPAFGEPQPQPRRELSEDGGSLGYSVVLTTAPAQNVTVSIGTGDRVEAQPASLTFTPANWDQPQSVQLSAVDNEVVDGDEFVSITATASSGDSGYDGLAGAPFDVYVLDNDAYGTVQFIQSAVTVNEDHGTLEVQVSRIGGQSGELTAQFTTVDGSALAGEDYTAVSGTLTWAHNDTAHKSIFIPILDDNEPEPPETFLVQLTAAANELDASVLGTPATLTVTILDDDNVNPAILLQSPADGATFEVGDVVPLQAEVTSNTANITEVRFFVNGSHVSAQTQPFTGSLYSFNWVASVGATTWHVQAFDDNAGESVSETRNFTLTPVPNIGNGGFLREIFYDVTGNNVSDLVGSPAYPDEADLFDFIDSGTMVYQNSATNYGTRLRAYFVAPKTGSYHFYLSATQRAELWLSSNELPGNAVKILNNVGAQNPGNWGHASQRSAAVPLVAGQRYYLEALHKAGTSGTRHIQVGVELPGGQLERPIPVAFLEPFDGVKVETLPQLVLVPEGGTALVHVRLRQQPFGELTLQSTLMDPVDGGESLEVIGGNTLNFTPANWNQWQVISLYAAPDEDAIDGEATLRLALNNGTWWDITAREIDAELNHAPTVGIMSPTTSSVNLPAGVGLLLEADAVDLDNDPLTVLWERVSGPGSVTFDDASALETGARFSADGDYLLRITVDDGEYSASAYVTVWVNPAAVTEANLTTTRGGSLSIDGGNWTLSGAGRSVFTSPDSARFAYSELRGDFDVSGRIGSFSSGPNWSFTGLHVRNSLNVNSSHFTAGAYRDGNTRQSSTVRYRINDGDSDTIGGQNLPGTLTDGWVRVTRTGNTFGAFHSTDGSSWTERVSVTISMGATAFVGLIVDNQSDGTTLATANWSNVSIPATVNLAPLVDAGPDATVDLGDSHTLAASFSGEHLPQGPLQTQWRKISGPGAVYANPAPPTEPDAAVSFELPGEYVLRFLVSNGEAVTFDDVTITVEGSEPLPPPPSGLTATAIAHDRIDLSWTDPTDPSDEFRIERSASGSTGWSLLATVTGTSHSDTGLAGGSTWYYRVITLRGGLESVPSGTASAATPAAPAGPVITTQPQSQSVFEGANVSFSVTATGNPAPEYQWRKHGVDLSGATDSTLTLTNVSFGDTGNYTVFVSNGIGEGVESDVAALSVNETGNLLIYEGFDYDTALTHLHGQAPTGEGLGGTWSQRHTGAGESHVVDGLTFGPLVVSGNAFQLLGDRLTSSLDRYNVVSIPVTASSTADTLWTSHLVEFRVRDEELTNNSANPDSRWQDRVALFPGQMGRSDIPDIGFSGTRDQSTSQGRVGLAGGNTDGGAGLAFGETHIIIGKITGMHQSGSVTKAATLWVLNLADFEAFVAAGRTEADLEEHHRFTLTRTVTNETELTLGGHLNLHTLDWNVRNFFPVYDEIRWGADLQAVTPVAGSPLPPLIPPQLSGLLMMENGRGIRIQTQSDFEYLLEYSDTLLDDPEWLPMGGWTRGNNSDLDLMDETPDVQQRFYRLRMRRGVGE
ncbi:MAG: S8 family serine peptidase [Verrucomicrobia bacterium]|nr:S8 family serine peptidase [Verrucomicrobiota bacterium]MCH8527811.1 S8 family serine peptidase [Kiritimatiellia bacterium]